MSRAALSLCTLLVLTAPAGLAAQEDAQPLTWLAFSKVKSGKMQDAVEMTLEYDRASYDKLVEEGAILAWGIATPINHRVGDPANHAVYVTLPGWKQVDRWVAEFTAVMQARGPEEMAKIQERVAEIYEPGSHFDSVRTNLVFSPPAEGAPLPRYYYISTFVVADGREGDFANIYQQVAIPVLQSLQAEGKVSGFGLQSQNLHGDAGWTHSSWTGVVDLETVQRMKKEVVDRVTPELGRRAAEIEDSSQHRDEIWLILHQSGAE